MRCRRLLSMEIEFSLNCNFHCPYCYVPENSVFKNELTDEEIRDVILQAKDLGAKRIIILGGEPMIYPHIMNMIRFINKQHLEIEMFTNGSRITAEAAKQLFDYKTKVVLKMNSFNASIHDMLSGKKDAFKISQKAFYNLKEAGYPSKEALLAVSTIICRQNIDELTDMWCWLRNQNIIPYFEMVTPQGNASRNEWLNVDSRKIYDIFSRIAEIDCRDYNHDWSPQPPLIGNKCLRHQFSCLVNSKGYVMPCVGVNIPVGNIREQKLKNIIRDSEVIQNLRDYQCTVKGPCGVCEKADTCYGCRGAAYQMTGDYLASDPLCWKNIDRQEEISYLPFAIDKLIPHQLPMRIIDSLLKVGERTADVEVNISSDMLFAGIDGLVDEAAYLEFLAQAIAALNGFGQMGASEFKMEGFLLGAKKLEVFGKAMVGDKLRVTVFKYARYGDFGIVKGSVFRGDDLLARGEIKIWHNTAKVKKETAVWQH